MNQPTEDRIKRLEEEQKRLREEQEAIKKRLEKQQTEPIPVTRIEVASEDVNKRLDAIQEDTGVLKIEMQGARADILASRESRADLRDRLVDHGQHLKAIEDKQDTHTEVLDTLLQTVATKDDIHRLEANQEQILKLLQQKSGE
jgi:chromosome segregation ATPase